jgi:hypothetical protein
MPQAMRALSAMNCRRAVPRADAGLDLESLIMKPAAARVRKDSGRLAAPDGLQGCGGVRWVQQVRECLRSGGHDLHHLDGALLEVGFLADRAGGVQRQLVDQAVLVEEGDEDQALGHLVAAAWCPRAAAISPRRVTAP